MNEVSGVAKVLYLASFLLRTNFLPFVDLLYGLFPHPFFRLSFSCNLLCSSLCAPVFFTFLYFALFLCFLIYFVQITHCSLYAIRRQPITNHTYAHTRQERVSYKTYEYSPLCRHLAGFKLVSKLRKSKEIYFVSLI